MKNLLTVCILALVMTMGHAIAQVQSYQEYKASDVPVQYDVPTAKYKHGKYCMDSRVF